MSLRLGTGSPMFAVLSLAALKNAVGDAGPARIGFYSGLRSRRGDTAHSIRHRTLGYIILARRLNKTTSVPETIRIMISVENRIS